MHGENHDFVGDETWLEIFRGAQHCWEKAIILEIGEA